MADVVSGKKSLPIMIVAAWAVVVLPTIWGLNYTVQNALKIFAKPIAPVSAPVAVPAK